jgi:hypothetical protein
LTRVADISTRSLRRPSHNENPAIPRAWSAKARRLSDCPPPNKAYLDSSRKLNLAPDGIDADGPTAVVSPASWVERSGARERGLLAR